MAENANENAPQEYGESMEKVIHGLAAHFGRLPTDNEVYRFIWGSPEDRQRIYTQKGLPESQR